MLELNGNNMLAMPQNGNQQKEELMEFLNKVEEENHLKRTNILKATSFKMLVISNGAKTSVCSLRIGITEEKKFCWLWS